VRLFDSGPQRVLEVTPARPGVLSLGSGTPSDPGVDSPEDLRSAVIADVIRRSAGLRRMRVVTVDTASAGDVARRSADRASLNVHPADLHLSPDDAIAQSIDVWVGGPGPGGHQVDIGPVTIDGHLFTATREGRSLVDRIAGRGLDPLTLRLVVLGSRYRDPLGLTWDGLAAADAALARWRHDVAGWATSSSAALPEDRVAEILRAVEDDLDTPRAMDGAHDLATAPTVSDGAKFEAFAYLDRVLGLDLARLVGRVSS
jgi:hypothetical protein